MLRLSVGMEYVEDLWADLTAALGTSVADAATRSTVRSDVPAGSHP